MAQQCNANCTCLLAYATVCVCVNVRYNAEERPPTDHHAERQSLLPRPPAVHTLQMHIAPSRMARALSSPGPTDTHTQPAIKIR